MTMPDDHLRDVFDRVAEVADPAARAVLLDQECGGDLALRERVEALLRAHDAAGSFLAHPPLAAPAETVNHVAEDTATAPCWGQRLESRGVIADRYKLLEEIGEGGMGTVWMAEQMEPVKRRVAIKLIKPGMDSRQVLARFEAERQALALMDHPNIARVLDGGATADGRPYFVMELVKGTPITVYCDDKRLPLAERLKLFADVCRAVQHAHQKGIIHRDLKPSNVLVAPYDSTPVVKVIDFGVAKAAGLALTERTLFTGFGTVIGTPEYMSPEQAELNNQDIDTRSDVYSLGILLYELLTGTTPLTRARVKQAALLEILRLVREEEPARPSTRLSTTDELPSIAALRGTEATKLSRVMRGELDWIVMKALEKDRSRRYETAAGLAADVDRYLSGEPVQAVPPSAGYRLRKFARRNRVVLGITTAVAVGLVVAVVGLSVSIALIQAESREKEGERNQKEQALGDLLREEQRRSEANAGWRRTAYFLKTAAALNEWRGGSRAGALQMLQECPEDLRHWEWDYLNRLCHSQSRDVPIGTAEDRAIAVLDATAERLATVDGKGMLRVYEVASGKELLKIPLRLGWITGVRFSPDGARMAIVAEGTYDRVKRAALHIRDARSGKERVSFQSPPFAKGYGPYFGLSFSPDGSRIVTLDMRGHLCLRDIDGQREVRQIDAHPITPVPHPNIGWYTSAAFSPDGTRIVTTSEIHPEGKVWDAGTGKEVLTLRGGGAGFNRAFYSPKGTWIVTVGRYRDESIVVPDTTVRLWNPRTGQQLRVFQGSSSPVTFALVSPDETRLVAGTQDGTVIIWDLVTGQKSGAYLTRDRNVWYMAFTADGRTLATLTRGFNRNDRFGRLLQFWDVTRGPEYRPFRCRGASQVALSPDGRRVLAAAMHPRESRQMAVLWDADTGDVVHEFGEPKNTFLAVAYSPDGKAVALAVQPAVGMCHINLYDPATGKLLRTLATPDGKPSAPCDALAFSTDGARLASGAQDQVVRLWEVATGRQLWESPRHQRSVSGLGFSHDGKRLVSTTGGILRISPSGLGNRKAPGWPTDSEKIDPVAKVWETETGREIMSLTLPGKTQAVAISPDGETVAAAFGRSKTIISIQLGFGAGSREAASFEDNPEGDKSIRLYGVPSGEVVATLKGHPRPTRAIAFSPDGQRIVTAGGSANTLKLWDPASGEEILTLGPQPAGLTAVAFNASGTRIVSGSLEEVRLWDATPVPPGR